MSGCDLEKGTEPDIQKKNINGFFNLNEGMWIWYKIIDWAKNNLIRHFFPHLMDL